MATVVLRRHARHEGRRVRVPARPAASSTGVDVLVVDAGVHEPVGLDARRRPGRGRARRRRRRRGARGGGRPRRRGRRRWARAPRRSCVRLYADGRLDGVARARRLGRLVDRGARDARAARSACRSCSSRRSRRATRGPYVGAVDVTMMYSVVDISGVNRVSARIMANAAARDRRAWRRPTPPRLDGEAARRRDDVRRHDAVRDRRRASGSRSSATRCSSSTRPARAASRWRRSSQAGFLAGVLDVTTTELADELVGGVLSAGPGPARGGGRGGRAAGRLARRARHGQLRAARDGAAAVRGAEPLRAQPDGDADAHDAGGVRASSAARSAASSSAADRRRRRCSSRSAASR